MKPNETGMAQSPRGHYAPVAEYRGVAILERVGSHRTVWNGTEYGTDGKFYLFFHHTPDSTGMLAIPTEREAKHLLDTGLVGDRLLEADNGKRFRLMSHRECVRLLCRGNPKMLAFGLAQQPCREWDESAGVFVQGVTSHQMLNDGQHRRRR